jgi:hypothetical protein
MLARNDAPRRQEVRLSASGLPIRNSLIPYSSAMFSDNNDHNPLVARMCGDCIGKGYIKRCNKNFQLEGHVCERCDGVGHFDEPVRYFDNDAEPQSATPNKYGWVKCPCCGTRFQPYDRNVFTGWRCACGQRVLIQSRQD